jgi:sterol 3beta-glucosyltransferase
LLPRNWAGGVLALWHTFNTVLRDVVAETARATELVTEGADHVVAAGLQFVAATVAEKQKIPYTYAALAPVSVKSAHYPPVPMAHLRTGPNVNGVGWRVAEWMANSAIGPALNRIRREMGLDPVSNVLGHVVYDSPALLAFSKHVCPPAPDWSIDHLQTGYWLFEDSHFEPSASLRHFISDGPPPIYLGFGYMLQHNRDLLRTMRTVLEAARMADVRVVVGGQWSGLGGGEARPGARAFIGGDLAHSWLFPRVSAVVHHGGAGTTAVGLRWGRPTGVIPHLGDQLFWGRRVHALGVGPAPVPIRQLTVQKLADLFKSLVQDEVMRERAAKLGEAIAAEAGPESAVGRLAVGEAPLLGRS